MEPVKFEKQIKDKLHKRRIDPSENSWEKLQARLETTEDKSAGFRFKWIGIAASLAGGILLWSLAFNSPEFSNTPDVVSNPSEEIPVEKIQVEEVEQDKNIQLASEETISPIKEKKSSVSEDKQEKNPQFEPRRETVALAVVPKEKETPETPKTVKNPVLEIISQEELAGKLKEVIATTSSKEEEGTAVTDVEVEELLRKAAAEISRENQATAANNIDAGSLLYEVEMELEKSFRDKVFEMLKESYFKTKTAVANRSF